MEPCREPTKKKKQAEDIVLLIPGEDHPHSKEPKLETGDEPPSSPETQTHSPEIVPKSSPEIVHRKLIPTSAFAKPKSRFEEHTGPLADSVQDSSSLAHGGSPNPRASGTPRTPKDDEEEEDEEEEDGEIYKKDQLSEGPVKRKKFRFWNLIEWSILVLAVSWFVTSFLVQELQGYVIWGLAIWKWCLMVAVVFCGRLVTHWFINFLVFLVERNFFLRKKVLYYVYALKKSAQVFIWLILILLTWSIVFSQEVSSSLKATKVLFFVSRLLVSLIIGSLIWLIKTLLVKILASSFHMNRFFDRIQESIFHQYILQSLSGLPVMEKARKIGAVASSGQLNFRKKGKGKGTGEKQEVIDISKLYKMRQEKVSAWTMKVLVNVISTSGLSTLSNTIGESFIEEEQREITSEWEAKLASYRIFKNVAKPGYK